MRRPSLLTYSASATVSRHGPRHGIGGEGTDHLSVSCLVVTKGGGWMDCVVVLPHRFFWKATPGNADHTGVKCKIMKAVTFPEVLDIYDFCTPRLQVRGFRRRRRVTGRGVAGG